MRDFKHVLEGVFRAPAEFLGRAVRETKREERWFLSKKPLRAAGRYFNTLGPGLTTGAADDDPSGIATYSQAGARYGFSLLWLSVVTFPLMAVVQEMCARIGIVSGEGLAANIRKHYSAGMLYLVCLLLFFANVLNIAADLGAMAASFKLLFPWFSFFFLVCIFASGILFLQIFTTYARYAKILKWLTLALLSYVFTAFAVHLPWGTVFYHAVWPSLTFSKDQLLLLCAILGTTISPYLFFWQTSQEVEERRSESGNTAAPHPKPLHGAIRRMRIDVWSGMFFSNAIMFFIIASCAATLYLHGITTIESAAQAALAIRPFGGELTFVFFAIGIIGTGLLAVPVLAGASAYALAESFGWKHGLYRRLSEAYAFYGVIIVSMVLAIIANLFGLDPIKGLIWAAVANGLVAPVVLFCIVHMSSRLPEHRNHPLVTAVGWLVVLLMTLSGIAALWALFF